jgi:hypothetical protein
VLHIAQACEETKVGAENMSVRQRAQTLAREANKLAGSGFLQKAVRLRPDRGPDHAEVRRRYS